MQYSKVLCSTVLNDEVEYAVLYFDNQSCNLAILTVDWLRRGGGLMRFIGNELQPLSFNLVQPYVFRDDIIRCRLARQRSPVLKQKTRGYRHRAVNKTPVVPCLPFYREVYWAGDDMDPLASALQ